MQVNKQVVIAIKSLGVAIPEVRTLIAHFNFV